MVALSTMSTKMELRQTDRFKIPLTWCAVKCEIQVWYGVPFWQFNKTTKTSCAFGHQCIYVRSCSLCYMLSPVRKTWTHQSKYHSCGSQYKKNKPAWPLFFPPAQNLHPWLQDCVELFKWDSSWVTGWLRSKQTSFLTGGVEVGGGLWENGCWTRAHTHCPHTCPFAQPQQLSAHTSLTEMLVWQFSALNHTLVLGPCL